MDRDIDTLDVIATPDAIAPPAPLAALVRLGDEIAELSAHLEAATARPGPWRGGSCPTPRCGR
jgi:hypothetical protein